MWAEPVCLTVDNLLKDLYFQDVGFLFPFQFYLVTSFQCSCLLHKIPHLSKNHAPGSLGYEHSPYEASIFRAQGPRGCQPHLKPHSQGQGFRWQTGFFFFQFQLRLWAEEAGGAFLCLVFKRTPIGYGELFLRDIPNNHRKK